MQNNQFIKECMEEVKTFDGTLANRKDCRFIKGNYYIKNKQCFLINGKWFRIDNENIVYDHELQTWVIKNIVLSKGAVGIDPSGKIEYGYFSTNNEKNEFLYVESGGMIRVLNEKILLDNPNIREGVNGVYYFNNTRNLPKDFTIKRVPRDRDNYYKTFRFSYSSEPLLDEFTEECSKHFGELPYVSNAAKHLSPYTFGVEFETSRGAIPEKYLKKCGLIACRDGSISGFEYVTVPLSGNRGVQLLKVQSELLRKYCECTENDSLHIHIGGYPKTIRALASLYRLACLIEREVYGMFPYYYADTKNFKRKSYCNPLPKVGLKQVKPRDIFSELYQVLGNGLPFRRSFPTSLHPMDRSGQHKWEVSPRYLWLNMIPMIWGNRRTLEFRCHTPTLNAIKVIYWLYIIIAILKYAKKHSLELTTKRYDELSDISLIDILNEAYPLKISSILDKYIKDRTVYYSMRNDPTGENEVMLESNGSDLFYLNQFV